MSTPSLRSKVVSGLFWLAATKALGQAITWIITLLVVRLLTPTDYGLMGMAVLVNGFLLLFNELGLGAAIVQRRELTQRDLSNLRWIILLVNVLLFGIVSAIAPLAAWYFEEPALTPLVRALGSMFILSGIGAPSSFVLIRRMEFRQKAQAEFVGNVLGGVTTLILAVSGMGVWSLIGGYLALQLAMNALYCVHAPIPLQAPSFDRSLLGSLRFGSQVALGKILWWISASADTMVIGKILGTVAVGYYGLAAQFASIPLDKVVSVITQVALPSFSALQHDNARLQRYYLKLVGLIAFITFPVFVGLILVADIAVHVLLTDKWAAIVLPLQLLSGAAILRSIETMNTPVLIAKGRTGIPLFNNVLQCVVLIGGFLIGTKWGISGVAMAWLCAWPMLYVVVTGQTLSVLRLSPGAYIDALRHAAAASAVMAAAILTLQRVVHPTPSLAHLIVNIGLGACCYVGYHAAFNRAALREALDTLRGKKPEEPATGPASPTGDAVVSPVTAEAR
jgi:O-antigen/teichoic acid export membrane protein